MTKSKLIRLLRMRSFIEKILTSDFKDPESQMPHSRGPNKPPLKALMPKSRSKKVAVVTGANRGVGLAVVRALCRHFDGDVILAARNKGLGKSAVLALQKEGLHPVFHHLELSHTKSMNALRDFLKEEYGGLDVLVNNAARLYPVFDDGTEFRKQAYEMLHINFFMTREFCYQMFPLLRKNARVCNMSSLAAVNCLELMHPNIQTRLLEPSLTMAGLDEIMADYLHATAVGVIDSGYVMSPMGAYGMSKVGLTVMTSIQQKAFDVMDQNRAEEGREKMGIIVNAASPGYASTDSNQGRGETTADEGAEVAVKLCLLPPGVTEPRGEFVRGNTIFHLTELTKYRQNIQLSDTDISEPFHRP